MSCPTEFENKKTIPIVHLLFVALVVIVLTAGFVAIVFKSFLHFKDWEDIYFLFIEFLLGCALFYFLKITGIYPLFYLKTWLREKRKHLIAGFKYFFIYFVSLVLLVVVVTTIALLLGKIGIPAPDANSKLFGIANQNKQIIYLNTVLLTSVPRFALYLFRVCVLAPIIEEIFYRRLLFVGLRKKFNFVPSLLISSLLFGAMHAGIVQVFVEGAYLGYVYEKEKNLPANILLHSLTNLLSIIIMILLWQS
ncbi:MAG: CPBP family intramembrane metalloprotease [Elusimicrobia bacterium]|nr:CPBP family intramembrane metalloprotease [Elusimicrobiota bacterium]